MFGLRTVTESAVMQDENPFGGGGSTSDIPPEVYSRYVKGTATEDDLVLLVQANEITPGQAQEYVRANGGSLESDLQDLGLVPLTEDPGYYVSSPEVTPNAEFSIDPRGNLIDNRYLQYGGTGGPTGIRSGGELNATERKRVLGSLGYSDMLDPYAGEENARANTRLAEQIRSARIQEAMSAIENRRAAINAMQNARLEAAGFALPAGTEFMPGLAPTSPIVRSGLADPFRANLINFDPSLVLDTGNQWQQDLARIRAGSGG